MSRKHWLDFAMSSLEIMWKLFKREQGLDWGMKKMHKTEIQLAVGVFLREGGGNLPSVACQSFRRFSIEISFQEGTKSCLTVFARWRNSSYPLGPTALSHVVEWLRSFTLNLYEFFGSRLLIHDQMKRWTDETVCCGNRRAHGSHYFFHTDSDFDAGIITKEAIQTTTLNTDYTTEA